MADLRPKHVDTVTAKVRIESKKVQDVLAQLFGKSGFEVWLGSGGAVLPDGSWMSYVLPPGDLSHGDLCATEGVLQRFKSGFSSMWVWAIDPHDGRRFIEGTRSSFRLAIEEDEEDLLVAVRHADVADIIQSSVQAMWNYYLQRLRTFMVSGFPGQHVWDR
ncbi:hypothetical protein [Frankia gtarii]|uniref:hypothetical protein n=1 Tax=Frankia gtarii TaxID=2950102 RepID=UPI0021BF0CD6|nr:hypothetical protein [Frankia gtarii]